VKIQTLVWIFIIGGEQKSPQPNKLLLTGLQSEVRFFFVRKYLIQITGLVQGLGFRPFVYRLAHQMGISGWVENDGNGVNICIIEVEEKILGEFLKRIQLEKPPLAEINSINVSRDQITNDVVAKEFRIKESPASDLRFSRLLPDIRPCVDCLQELFDPVNRRYLYPFINCTNCGPRYSIIEEVPYDRKRTSMRHFKLCTHCGDEYSNPLDRRFHAEPIACSVCGPQLQLWRGGKRLIAIADIIAEVVLLLEQGQILALKGIGGFQLIVDAANSEAVRSLRIRKKRPSKPFAVMMPDMAVVQSFCEVSSKEDALLNSCNGPIVLLKKLKTDIGFEKLASTVAPDNPYLGVFLPSSPLHYLIMKLFGRALVVTSGNISDEPICISDEDALSRLGDIADYFLIHNREVVRPLDDSIVQVIGDRIMTLRVGRGYAPQYFGNSYCLHDSKPKMALGSQLKNTVAFYNGKDMFLSQHFGDLDRDIAQHHYDREVKKIIQYYNLDINAVEYAGDLHPNYYTSQWLREKVPGKTYLPIQHHKAHLFAATAELAIQEPCLGVIWDGTGLGDDGSIWGGEFFYVLGMSSFDRIGSVRPFSLVGGESAIRNPWKILFGIVSEITEGKFLEYVRDSKKQWTKKEEELLLAVLKSGINCPRTSSMGRLFDAVASLLCHEGEVEFEAQAAMKLEFHALEYETPSVSDDSLLQWIESDYSCPGVKLKYLLDWEPLMRKLLGGFLNKDSTSYLAYSFHVSLARSIFDLAQLVNVKDIVLAGGVFQNRLLLAEVFRFSKISGVNVHLPERVPVNDGGVAFGQLLTLMSDMSDMSKWQRGT
jgi:hydrogenase maturation protein HypF